MKIKDCMCYKTISVMPNTTVEDVAKKMKANHIGCMPVCNEQKSLVGLVTDRDLVLRCIACEKDPKIIPVSDIMTTKVYTADPDDYLEDVTATMCECNVRRIPVVEEGLLKGMITISDLSVNPSYSKERLGAVVEGICGVHSKTKNAE